MRQGLHIDLEGKDVAYEYIIRCAYPTTLEARRNGGDRRHIKNLAYTYMQGSTPCLPTYQQQLDIVKKSLHSAIHRCFYNIKFPQTNHSSTPTIQKKIIHYFQQISAVENHTQLYPIIDNLVDFLEEYGDYIDNS